MCNAWTKPHIRGKKSLMLIIKRKIKRLNNPFQPLSRNRNPNMTQNEHVYAICYRLEVDGDAISGRNVKTVERYIAVNVEVSISTTFCDILK